MGKKDDKKDKGKKDGGGPEMDRRKFFFFGGGAVAAAAVPSAAIAPAAAVAAVADIDRIRTVLTHLPGDNGLLGLSKLLAGAARLKPDKILPDDIHPVYDLLDKIKEGESTLPLLEAVAKECGDMPLSNFLDAVDDHIFMAIGNDQTRTARLMLSDINPYSFRELVKEGKFDTVSELIEALRGKAGSMIEANGKLLSSLTNEQVLADTKIIEKRWKATTLAESFPEAKELERFMPDRNIMQVVAERSEFNSALSSARSCYRMRLYDLEKQVSPQKFRALEKKIGEHVEELIKGGEKPELVGRRVKFMLDTAREHNVPGSSKAFDARYFEAGNAKELTELHQANTSVARERKKTRKADKAKEAEEKARKDAEKAAKGEQPETEVTEDRELLTPRGKKWDFSARTFRDCVVEKHDPIAFSLVGKATTLQHFSIIPKGTAREEWLLQRLNDFAPGTMDSMTRLRPDPEYKRIHVETSNAKLIEVLQARIEKQAKMEGNWRG